MFGLNLGHSGNPGTRDKNTITTVEPIKKPPQHQIQQSIVSFNTQQALANLMALSRLTQNGAGISSLFENPSQNSQPTLQTPISNSADNMLMSSNNLMTTTEHAQMQIRCKFGTLGEFQGQFQSPHGFTMGRDEEIVVADTYNHRIQVRFRLFLSNI